MSTVIKTVYSAAGCDIVSKPYLVSEELSALSLQCSVDFVNTLSLTKEQVETATVVEILNGGRYYYMPEAIEKATNFKPRVMQLQAKRFFDEKTQDWQVRTFDRVGQCSGGIVIIGDTVATGATLAGTLNLLVDELIEQKHALHDIYVFAIAGSDFGRPRLDKVAEKLGQQGAKLHLVCANSCFDLAENGTDLMFGDHECVENEKRYDPQAWKNLTAEVGCVFTELKCAVWDWGDRFTKPQHHLEELEHHVEAEVAKLTEGTEKHIKLSAILAEIKSRRS